MRLRSFLKFVLAGILLFCLFTTNAQSYESDSLLFQRSKQQVIDIYHRYINTESGLYNGRQYLAYAHTIQEGIPFFKSSEPSKGSVSYDGVFYENIPLLYDILKGVIITVVPSSNYMIQLNNDKVAYFSLLDHYFIKLLKDSSAENIKTGFYDVLYHGKISVYKKTTKTVGEDVSSGKYRNFIVESNTYYLKKGNSFYVITNKGSVLGLLKDRKKELQQFIKKNKLNFRKDKDNALPRIAAIYDELSKTTN
jgi:hypothetical protein